MCAEWQMLLRQSLKNQVHHLLIISQTRMRLLQNEVRFVSDTKKRLLLKIHLSTSSMVQQPSVIVIVTATKSLQTNMKFFVQNDSFSLAHLMMADSSNISKILRAHISLRHRLIQSLNLVQENLIHFLMDS